MGLIVSFYDKNFKGLQDNASLVVDDNSYKLTKRSVDFDSLSCTCERYIEDIQPTFLIIKNSLGNYVYGCLAGIPTVGEDNKTKITGTDLKTMFNSDIIVDLSTATTVQGVINTVFNAWKTDIVQGSFDVEIENNIVMGLTDLKPSESQFMNAWNTLKSYMKYYNLYMISRVDLINKKVIFTVKQSMTKLKNIQLWEHGNKDYGKWIANVNETQGVVKQGTNFTYGYKWILTSNNAITTNTANRDIYPIKKNIIFKETEKAEDVSKLLSEANAEALTKLCDSLYNEDINISGIELDFDSKCAIYIKRGGAKYKDLPVGELTYNSDGLKSVKIGYRFTGLEFIK